MIGAASLISRQAAIFAVSGAAVAAAVTQQTVAYAEDKPVLTRRYIDRKPIYDDVPLTPPEPVVVVPPPKQVITTPTRQHLPGSVLDALAPIPTVGQVTDQLAAELRKVRLGLFDYAAAAEDKTNDAASRVFRLENRVTERIAALAPSAKSQERVGPGLLTAVVATMGASIFTRNSNVIVRATVPITVGLIAAQSVLPETMHNIHTFVLDIEQKISPELRQNHENAVARVDHFVATGKAHSRMSIDMLEGKIADARLALADWVQGR